MVPKMRTKKTSNNQTSQCFWSPELSAWSKCHQSYHHRSCTHHFQYHDLIWYYIYSIRRKYVHLFLSVTTWGISSHSLSNSPIINHIGIMELCDTPHHFCQNVFSISTSAATLYCYMHTHSWRVRNVYFNSLLLKTPRATHEVNQRSHHIHQDYTRYRSPIAMVC